MGAAMARLNAKKTVCPPPLPLGARTWWFVCLTLFLNTAVTLGGLALYRNGVIRVREAGWGLGLLDSLVLFLVMDLAMYVFHRVAHHPFLFSILHREHHEVDRLSPLHLFYLNPLENLGFGALWLALLCLYPATWMGMGIYLALNLIWGTMGHSGVEPLPRFWAKLPLMGVLTGGTFHARHHQDPGHCFGFYTVIWDLLFRSMKAGYVDGFAKVPQLTPPPEKSPGVRV